MFDRELKERLGVDPSSVIVSFRFHGTFYSLTALTAENKIMLQNNYKNI